MRTHRRLLIWINPPVGERLPLGGFDAGHAASLANEIAARVGYSFREGNPMLAAETFLDDLSRFHADTQARLDRLKPNDTIKGMFLKGYLAAYRSEGGDLLYQQCRALVGEKSLVDFFSYPYSSVMRMGLVGAEVLAPKLGGVAPFLRAMGRIAVNQYLESTLGKTFLGLANPSPKAMLSLLPAACRTSFSFGERNVTFRTNACTFTCRNDFSPAEANAGAIEAVIVAAQGKTPAVIVKQYDLLNYDLEASWT